jgi:poly-gamma-glutamate synthesis protein (capsule biosynthesis protein)
MDQLNYDSEKSAFSVLAFHWGDEHTNYPKLEHINLAKQIAKKRDVIIAGHHPHIIQGVQDIKKSVIAYSLGNFVFDDCVSITGGFELKQNIENKKSFILEVEIENRSIKNKEYRGFIDQEDGLVCFDMNNELNKISKPLYTIEDSEKYEAIRISQINKVRQQKFGKRDIKWLMSRLNYYSLGAYIITKFRKKKYLKEKKKFLGGSQI